MRKLIPIVFLSIILCNPISYAQIVYWNMYSQSSWGTSPLVPTSKDANVTIGSLTKGSGMGTSGTAASRAWGGTSWNSASVATGVTAGAYFTFTVTANSGYTFSATACTLIYRRSTSGPQHAMLQYQLGSGSFVDVDTLSFPSSSSSGATSTKSLSSVSALQNVASGTTVTFRVVPYGASASNGTFYIYNVANNASSQDLVITGSTASSTLTPPTLTANTTTNNVDNNFDITYTDNSTWRTAVTAVKVGSTTLASGSYSLAAGALTLKPSNGDTSLTHSGTKTVTITANGYSAATISQVINPGAVSSSTSTSSISSSLSLNGTSTVTVTAKDQYSNAVSGYTFKVLPTITNATATTAESYTVNGTTYTSTPVSAASLASTTNSSGTATFTVIVPATVDGGDGISVQVTLNNGTTNVGSAFSYIAPTSPSLSISSSTLTEANLNGASINLILSNATFSDATLLASNFTLNNAPSGTSVSGVTYNSTTSAALTLTFNGTDFDSNVSNLTVSIAASELSSGAILTSSNSLTITAITETAPTVTTTSISGISTSDANSGGNITSDGGGTTSAAVTARGVVWSTSSSPTVDLTTKTSDGTGTGSFTSAISGLASNTTYYVRAYATNSVGTGYGTEVSFTTYAKSPTTQAASIVFSAISNSSVTVSFTPGNGTSRLVVAHAGGAVDSDPVDYTTYTASAVFKGGTQIGTSNYVVYSGTGSSVTLTGLSASTTYYFAVYEFNGSAGTQDYLQSTPLTGSQVTSTIPILITHYSPRYTGASDELIVLFNNTQSNFDLNGYQIDYSSSSGSAPSTKASWTTSTIIPSRKYYLISPNTTVSVGTVSQTADKTYTAGLADAGQIAFRKTSDTSTVFALATGSISSYKFYLTTSADTTTSSSLTGMIMLTKANDTSYNYTGNLANDYIFVASASITEVPNSGSVAFPVELTALTVSVSGRNVILNWNTATEVNSYKFVVERSKSGSNQWNALGEVRASNYSNSPKQYSFVDKNLNTGKVAYRLQMVDNDGSYEYSPAIEADIVTPIEFKVSQNYPNPFNPSTTISVDLPVNAQVTLELFALTGTKVATLYSAPMKAGYNAYSLNMGKYNLSSGTYFYKATMRETASGKVFTQTRKLVYMK